MIRVTACGLMVGVLLLVGCAEWVNIPKIPGDAARHDPNLRDVADVEVAALSALMTRFPTDGQTQIILPMGSDAKTYTKVVNSVGRGAVMDDPSVATTLEVKAVRIRVSHAWVDIRRLSDTRIPQLYTIYLKNDVISGWYMQRIRPWRGTINEGDHVPTQLQEERAMRTLEMQQPEPAVQPAAQPTAEQTTVRIRTAESQAQPGTVQTSTMTTATTTTVSTPAASAPPVLPSRTVDSDDVQVISGGVVEIVE